MIAKLTGTLSHKAADHCIIDVGGVGYQVNISLSTFGSLPDVGSIITLEVHTHVREDQLTLYGFCDQPEKSLFQKLISISGVGPKMALAILSGLPVRELVCAIGSGDCVRLSTIPGVGKKTANRIVVELKEKIARDFDTGGSSSPTTTGGFYDDALSALTNLGYKRNTAENVLKDIDTTENARLEEVIKSALRELNRV